jgi:hypothetical protein
MAQIILEAEHSEGPPALQLRIACSHEGFRLPSPGEPPDLQGTVMLHALAADALDQHCPARCGAGYRTTWLVPGW